MLLTNLILTATCSRPSGPGPDEVSAREKNEANLQLWPHRHSGGACGGLRRGERDGGLVQHVRLRGRGRQAVLAGVLLADVGHDGVVARQREREGLRGRAARVGHLGADQRARDCARPPPQPGQVAGRAAAARWQSRHAERAAHGSDRALTFWKARTPACLAGPPAFRRGTQHNAITCSSQRR